MRPDLSPLEQLRVEGAFTADDMADLVATRGDERSRLDGSDTGKDAVVLRGEAEIDYALARFVAANCGADAQYAVVPTSFVLKGGLAIYTCFAGSRRSKDADISPSGLEAEIDGLLPPELIDAPAGMRILEPTQATEDGWRVPVEFTTTIGVDVATIICDLNNGRRTIRRRPAVRRPFDTPFTTAPPKVWVARPEEMIGEKISALLRRRNGRLRDIFDIDHLLARADELELDLSMIREVSIEAISELVRYPNLRPDVREMIETRTLVDGDVSWARDEIERIGNQARASSWNEQVADVVAGAGTNIEVTASLIRRWDELRLLDEGR